MGNVSKHEQRPSDFLLGIERAEKFTFSLLIKHYNLYAFWEYSVSINKISGCPSYVEGCPTTHVLLEIASAKRT
jgi:hypothetical protein